MNNLYPLLLTSVVSLYACGQTKESSLSQNSDTKPAGSVQRASEDLNIVKNSVPKDWQKISGSFFSFFAPSDFVKIDLQRMDSGGGTYKSSQMKIDFDYGIYTAPIKDADEVIGGRNAKIVVSEKASYDGIDTYSKVASVGFEDLGQAAKNLSIVVAYKSDADPDVVKTILRSVQFP